MKEKKSKTSAKNESSPKRAQVKFKTNEIESIKTFVRDDSDYEEDSDHEEAITQEENESIDNTESTSNSGWADVMQKILKTNKPKRKKTIVLAKAKKLCDVKLNKKKEDLPFEIDSVEKEKTESKEASVETVEHTIPITSRIKKNNKEKSLGIRIKPFLMDQEHERMLKKIATRGVVQLFNAVKEQQTCISKKISEAGPLERKREQVLKNIDKNAFLDILMGGSKSISIDKSDKNTIQNKENKDDKTWSILRDGFVMGAKLKDWDKKDEEQDSSAPEDMDIDD